MYYSCDCGMNFCLSPSSVLFATNICVWFCFQIFFSQLRLSEKVNLTSKRHWCMFIHCLQIVGSSPGFPHGVIDPIEVTCSFCKQIWTVCCFMVASQEFVHIFMSVSDTWWGWGHLLSKFEYAVGSHLELSFCWLSVG
jgi:hypothetical protein